MPCIHPYEVKWRLLNENLSHFNCLYWEEKKKEKWQQQSKQEREGRDLCSTVANVVSQGNEKMVR